MGRKQLTAKQHQFLEFLAEHVRKTRVWPTYREIVDRFEYRSPNSVTQNLQALEKKGYLTRDGDGYRLIGERKGLAGGGFPVKGTVADGDFEAALTIEDVTIGNLFPDLAGASAVRMEQTVRGVDVRPGDFLLLSAARDVGDGSLAGVLVDGEAAVVRVLREKGAMRLQYLDGHEERVTTTDRHFRMLGRYRGHINRLGLYCLPPLPASDGSSAAAGMALSA